MFTRLGYEHHDVLHRNKNGGAIAREAAKSRKMKVLVDLKHNI